MKFLSEIKEIIDLVGKQQMKIQVTFYTVVAVILIVLAVVPIVVLAALCGSDKAVPGNVLNGGRIAYKGSVVYAVNPEDSKIYRIKGESRSAVSEITHCKNLVVNKNYIYYIGGIEYGKNGIYKTNLKNHETTMIYNGNTPLFNIYGDAVYFISSVSDGGKMSAMKLDGSRRRELSKLTVTSFDIGGGSIFYCDGKQNLYSNDLDGKSETLIDGIKTSCFMADKKRIYYLSGDSLMKCKFSGEKKQTVFTSKIKHFNIYKNRVYFSSDGGIFDSRANNIYSGSADGVYMHKKEILTFAGNEIVRINPVTGKTKRISF